MSDNPIDLPDDTSDSSMNGTVYKNIGSGRHYFHIKAFRNGVWGGVSTFAINVDVAPPAKFKIQLSPSAYTTGKNVVINFGTTDVDSGIDYYEYKVIALGSSYDAHAQKKDFFIEATPPIIVNLDYGAYDIIARAYDKAGNISEIVQRLKIVTPVVYALTNVFTVISLALVLLLFGLGAWYARKRHLGFAATKIQRGLPEDVMNKLGELKRYQSKYGKILMMVAIMCGALIFSHHAAAEEIELSPPFITTISENISNNEIFYIGGKTDSSHIEVVIYLQNLRTGSTLSESVTSDKKGDWFYRYDSFLESGGYLLWTQAKLGDLISPPSPQIRMTVVPTAIQFGATRISYEALYIAFIALLAMGIVALASYMGYHLHQERRKKTAFFKEIREAKMAITQGFAVLKKDIESQLTLIRNIKLTKELQGEEREKEKQLLDDLTAIEIHIREEVGDIESLGV